MSHNSSARSLLVGEVQHLGWRTELPPEKPPRALVTFWFSIPVIISMRTLIVPWAPSPAKDIVNSCQAFFATADLQNGLLIIFYH